MEIKLYATRSKVTHIMYAQKGAAWKKIQTLFIYIRSAHERTVHKLGEIIKKREIEKKSKKSGKMETRGGGGGARPAVPPSKSEPLCVCGVRGFQFSAIGFSGAWHN